MYIYPAAVHNLDAEFTFFRNGDLECLLSRELKNLYHFTHASILLMYLTTLTLSALVASCVFCYSLEPDQTDNMNFVTTLALWWYS